MSGNLIQAKGYTRTKKTTDLSVSYGIIGSADIRHMRVSICPEPEVEFIWPEVGGKPLPTLLLF